MQEKLVSAIKTYLSSTASDRHLGATKANITRLANQLGEEIGSEAVRSLVFTLLDSEQPNRVEWLRSRFTFGSLYLEGDRVFGWHSESNSQVQAEHLPLIQVQDQDNKIYLLVNFAYGKRDFFESVGFAASEHLPLKFSGDRYEVDFKVERSQFWVQYGYALPCPIQWSRTESGLCVIRSVISEGFWCAYKWWEGCKWWYFEKHPEWFIEDEMYGEISPPEHQYAAVLGNKNRAFWESRKYF